MAVILDTIDAAIERKQKVFCHCIAGRGRTGLVAACYAARHGVASGERALNWVAQRRYKYGLFRPSPETEEQREFVRLWKEGQ
jgi:protein-tyrosine phosphatase